MTKTFEIKRAAPFVLSDEDKRRLLRFALLFDLPVSVLPNCDLRISTIAENGTPLVVELPPELAYCRLLMELCSRTTRWLYYNPQEHCRETLLRLSDAKIARLAQLHKGWLSEMVPAPAPHRRTAKAAAR